VPVDFNEQYFRDLSRSAGVRAVVDEAAERVAARARATAPVDSGAYRDSIHTTGKLQDRYVGLVIASDEAALAIEARTGNLARAVKASGRGRR
jgi:hypothetical protein